MTQPTEGVMQITRGDDALKTITFDQAVASFSAVVVTIREKAAREQTDNTDATWTGSLASGAITALSTYALSLTIPKAATVLMLRDAYVYDVQVVTTPGGKTHTTERGRVLVGWDVSRP
jgi:hypothetical protein